MEKISAAITRYYQSLTEEELARGPRMGRVRSVAVFRARIQFGIDTRTDEERGRFKKEWDLQS